MTSDPGDPTAPGPSEPRSPASPTLADRELYRLGGVSAGGVRVLIGLVRLIGIVAFLVGAVEASAGVAFAEPRAIALGALAGIFGLWVISRGAALAGPKRESTITWIAARSQSDTPTESMAPSAAPSATSMWAQKSP